MYAIGDIHGRVDLLDKILSLIEADIAQYPVSRIRYIFLGDYIDRGRWSRETIDRLIQHAKHHESIFLRGNHELLAVNSLSDRSMIDPWLRLGGLETLISYGVKPANFAGGKQTATTQSVFHDAVPQSHFRFFRSLQNSFECGDFFFAHAGVKPDVQLSDQKESDLLWIRGEFLTSDRDFGKIVVHGHTITLNVEVRPNRINIDTGAFATDRLSCLVMERDSLFVIDTSQS